MAPEYGASTGYFPVDGETLAYLRLLGRDAADVALVENYARANGLWFDPKAEPVFTRTITIDLAAIEPSVAGPKRPQDRMPAGHTAKAFAPPLAPPLGGIPDGAVAIAAITSCTNTSDQRMLVSAGLLAHKAAALGLKPPPYVKTSLAPGSPTAEALLTRAGLLEPLEAIGFGIVGFGCTTCIGNSGALTPQIAAHICKSDIRPVAVLSGNRNFPGRVHPDLEFGFLASPPMVIAFALAGTVNIDITRDTIGIADGREITLADLWPSNLEIDAALARALDPTDFARAYEAAAANPLWQGLEAPVGDRFPWDLASTYLRRPPFVRTGRPSLLTAAARPLLVLGDDITTDHISPAGAIKAESETGRYLIAGGENPADLNVHASRRGNFESMVRGAFTNRLAKNLLVPDQPAGLTRHEPSGEVVALTEAAKRYGDAGVPLVIVAGERYGMGSSRDWAAKAVALLRVRAVLAVSFERIHRTNLIGMGVLPLILPAEAHPTRLALASGDQFDLDLDPATYAPRASIAVRLHRANGQVEAMTLRMAIETSLEVELLRSGGLIPHVLKGLIGEHVA
jgi:aconitate hydratase